MQDYRNDFEELLTTLDTIRYIAATQEGQQAATNMKAAASSQLYQYTKEPLPLTAIRDHLSGVGYDQYPLLADQTTYGWVVPPAELAFMEPHLKTLRDEHGFTVTTRIAEDQPGTMNFDVTITRVVD